MVGRLVDVVGMCLLVVLLTLIFHHLDRDVHTLSEPIPETFWETMEARQQWEESTSISPHLEENPSEKIWIFKADLDPDPFPELEE